MKPLAKRLRLVERSAIQAEYERRHARAVASRAAYEHLRRRHQQGLLSDHTWQILAPTLQEHNRALAQTVRQVMTADPRMESDELETARREYLRAQRSAINSLRRDGIISDEVYAQLIAEVDAAITRPQAGWFELLGSSVSKLQPVNYLMAVVIQEEDVENASSALTKLGLSVTCIASSGGFLREGNVTLLIGLAKGQEEAVVQALQSSCRQRVKYLSAPVEGLPPDLAQPIQVSVGGATLFVFEVERYEAF